VIRFLLTALVGITAVLLSACARARPAATATLRCGYTEFRPYTSINEQGMPEGLAVEIVRRAAGHAGLRLDWVQVDDTEAALRRGEVDLVPLVTVTAAREREFYVGVPWWEYSQVLVSRRDRPLHAPADTVGKRVGVRGLAWTLALAETELPGSFLVPARTSRILEDICAGSLDGALLEGRLLHAALLDQPSACRGWQLDSRPLPGAVNQMASMARKGSADQASRIYQGIQEMVADGEVSELANRWFFMPQQRYVRQRLIERERRQLELLYAAGFALLLVSVGFWRRARLLRRAAQDARALAEAVERRFEAFMLNSPALSMLKDASGRILYVNKAFERIYRVRAEDAAGRPDTHFFHGQTLETMRAQDAEVLRTGEPQQGVYEISDGTGERRHWMILTFRIGGEAGGPLIGLTAIDISEQQLAAELVRRSEERFLRLFEEAPVAMHEIDGDGLVCRTNRAECELLGLAPDQILGRHASEFVMPEDRDQSRASVAAKLAGLKPLVPFERCYSGKDGTLLLVEVHEAAILGPSGLIQGIRSCLVDLTGRYEAQKKLDEFAEELQQKNTALVQALAAAEEATRLKSQFLAHMSHEIRTPMNGILGMTELLLAAGLTDDQKSLARAAAESGEHLLGIINDILDFSKIEAGRVELERIPFDLWETVEAAAGLMAPGAHAKGIELICHVEPEVPQRVFGDPARLRQVLLNLVGNAIKFTSKGDIALLVSGGGREGEKRAAIGFSVVDTGIGIPEEALAGLFTAITQADSTTTRRFGGTGLGLAIAQRIVNLMGGEMGVNSRLGKGSTFWFNLEMECESSGAERPLCPELVGRRLLVVDDKALSRNLLLRHAGNWGLRATAAAGATDALELMRAAAAASDPFTLAAVDASMPGMNVGEFCRVMAEDASLAVTRAVLMRPLGVPLPAGCTSAFVSKPVRPRELLECLKRLAASGPEHSPKSAIVAKPETKPQRPARGRILIAEDNPVNQRVATLQLKSLGYEADVVPNGAEALEALERLAYALVLMDCQMPHMDGLTATRELRIREREGHRTPVIAMTANAFASDREACMEAGMDDFLSKPVNLNDLSRVIERWSGENAKMAAV
jgi:PAS domain S-box-containing protein